MYFATDPKVISCGGGAPCRLFIHATNIHVGGGRMLLHPLLSALSPSIQAVALLDSRMLIPDGVPESLRVILVNPSVVERFKAERWLSDNVRIGDVVLCFGNLPPIYKLSGHTVVYLQNRYLIDYFPLSTLSFKARIKLLIERLWFFCRITNADEIFVQTPAMKMLLQAYPRASVPVRVLPFMAKTSGYSRKLVQKPPRKEESYEFLYIASGEPHKNHLRLIDAWRLLAEDGLFPSLTLTLDETQSPKLCREIKKACHCCGLKVRNMGKLSHDATLALYKEVDALIYPSTLESLGLPLIEARQAGLSVLASELDYVRDVLDPDQSFDPYSAISMARAIKRFMGVDEIPLPLLDAKCFLDMLVKDKLST